MSQTFQSSAKVAEVHARYQWMHLLVDFAAAFLFVLGSALFFYPSQEVAATWCFLVGSIFFAFKPTIRLAARLHEARIVARFESDIERAAERL